MTTDRDTLLAVNDILHRSFVAGRRTYAHQFAKAQSEIIELIDAHDNALKERAVREARVSELGRFMSRTEPTPQQDRYYNDRIAELTSKERDR